MNKNKERLRLLDRADNKGWKKWGPYLSDRQWGTVREDYSVYGDAWDYLSHDMARSRAYRWGEDGIGGISDNKQHICFSLAFWNHKDSIIKERFFGLTGNEGNHGEDVKELYYYLDSTPSHSYMKMLYKYPVQAFPYAALKDINKELSRKDDEFEIINSGVFDNQNYFDIFIEYAKADENDICIKITAHNRSQKDAPLMFLPTLWFRNTWDWGYEEFEKKPMLTGISNTQVEVSHGLFDRMKLYTQAADEFLFTENETNKERVFGKENTSPHVKDAINDYIVSGDKSGINPNHIGTKFSAKFDKIIKKGDSETIYLRFTEKTNLKEPFADIEKIFEDRINDANDFYGIIQKDIKDEENKSIQRQAFAGMLWSKQFYYYNIDQWMKGDPKMPFEFRGRSFERNATWKHAYMANILSMPDKWEYPWFAAWDLAFHTVTLARVDSDFAKRQLAVILREYYMHPNGQIPAYEWNFSDVNPPVHAWATWKVYEIDKEINGQGDIKFLERIFHKLLLNFTWWVNQKDEDGNNIFGGGFLGLDNIGVFDRNEQIPGITLQQADATGWMAIYTLNMLKIACEIALDNPAYQDMASKFFEHFLYIAAAINKSLDDEEQGLWDEEDQFYYDKINTPEAKTIFLKIRSLVGLIPLCAIEVIDDALLEKLPDFKRRLEWILKNRPDLASLISRWEQPGKGQTHLLSLLRGHRMKMVFNKLFDENEFLSDYGIRSLSKFHKENPYIFDLQGEPLSVAYTPGESDLTIMGGNSNWRGPIWFPLNYLIIDSLNKYAEYYGDDYEVEYPTNSGKIVTIKEAANLISKRLISIFKNNETNVKPFHGDEPRFQNDPNFENYIHFFEYFHGDSGKGLGAAHQTGWTGLVADLIHETSKY